MCVLLLLLLLLLLLGLLFIIGFVGYLHFVYLDNLYNSTPGQRDWRNADSITKQRDESELHKFNEIRAADAASPLNVRLAGRAVTVPTSLLRANWITTTRSVEPNVR